MKSSHTEKAVSYKNTIYRCILFLAAVALIVYFLPRQGDFNYQFEINKPWKYGLLQASFDFPIYKNEKEVKQEQDSIMAGYTPYFTQSEQSFKDAVSLFRTDYEARLQKIIPGPSYLRHIEQQLKTIYQTGIIGQEDLLRLRKDSIYGIQVVNRNTSALRSVSEIYSIKQAYETLINADTIHFSKQLLQRCNLNNYLIPNLLYDKEKSDLTRKDLLSGISWANGFVMNGQKIIDRGEIITPQTYNILKSLQKEWNKRSETATERHLTLLGQTLFVAMLIGCFIIYLALFRKEYYNKKETLNLLFFLIVFFSVISSVMISRSWLSVYIIPFSMIPMIVRTFLDSRTAFMTHTIAILICSICLRTPHEFLLLQSVAGMVSIYSLNELSQRSQLLRSAVIVVAAYALLYFALDLIHVNSISLLSTRTYIHFVINGILLLFTYPLLLILEKTFGFTSNVTLVELSNINNKLMREMSEVAPGTFQHSLQLANLTAAAANKIGANGQLVRTGAMYHDIGKMLNPAFFTENQSGVNPHNQLDYKQSAQIVISHITDGMKLADKHNLPQVIKDFICTHHGEGLTKYFYVSYLNEHPDEEVDKSVFQYPGPNPFTKEQAILMMADSVEAASRSLPEYTEESISGLVDKIIDTQVQEGFFKECPITFRDIATVKSVFKEKLKTMYHTRISYPELKK